MLPGVLENPDLQRISSWLYSTHPSSLVRIGWGQSYPPNKAAPVKILLGQVQLPECSEWTLCKLEASDSQGISLGWFLTCSPNYAQIGFKFKLKPSKIKYLQGSTASGVYKMDPMQSRSIKLSTDFHSILPYLLSRPSPKRCTRKLLCQKAKRLSAASGVHRIDSVQARANNWPPQDILCDSHSTPLPGPWVTHPKVARTTYLTAGKGFWSPQRRSEVMLCIFSLFLVKPECHHWQDGVRHPAKHQKEGNHDHDTSSPGPNTNIPPRSVRNFWRILLL